MLESVRRRLAAAAADPLVRSAAGRVAAVLRVVTSLGWTVVVLAAVSWVAAAQLGWGELERLTGACVVVLVGAALFLLGRATLEVEVELSPQRVQVGAAVAGTVRVTNVSTRRLLPLRLELPNAASFNLPALAPGAWHEEPFTVPTPHRAVVPIGPATTVRGDPLGLLRRSVAWTGTTELFVHPPLVQLDASSWGFLRDLEGRATDDISPSDLSFHTLREYVPGDDIRHVHWKSSARAQQLLVRQFTDTRRSHLVVLVDGQLNRYADADDFETALSVGGSLALRNLRDDQDTSVLFSDQVLERTDGRRALDALARSVPRTASLVDLVRTAVRLAPDVSMCVLVTGPVPAVTEVQQALSLLPSGTRLLVLRVDASATPGTAALGLARLLTLSTLADLPLLVRSVASR